MRDVILTLAAGSLMALAHPPAGLWPLSFAGAGLLLAAFLRGRSMAAALAAAFGAKAVFAAAVFWYLWGISPSVLALYVANVGLAWCGLGAAFHAIRSWRGDAAALAAAACLWPLFDWAAPRLNFLPSSVPGWFTALADSPLAVLAPWLGLYGLTFLAAASSALPLLFLQARRPDRRREALLMAAALAAAAVLPGAALRLSVRTEAGLPRTLKVAAVSLSLAWERPAAAFDDLAAPWTVQRRLEFARFAEERMREIVSSLGEFRPDLVILPEDAIDAVLDRDISREVSERWGIDNGGALIEAYRDLARRIPAAVAVGLTAARRVRPPRPASLPAPQAESAADGRYRNAVLLIDRDGSLTGRYDKVRLTAGSEYWPLAGLRAPYWRLFDTGPGSGFAPYEDQYAPGNRPLALLRLGEFSFGTPVCLEGQIPERSLGWKRRGADFLAYLSNAHWLRLDPAGYDSQTLSLARIQSAAYAIPIFLAGKMASCGFVDPDGNVRVRAVRDEASGTAVIAAEVTLRTGSRTVVSRCGEYALPASAAALLLVLALPAWIRAREG